MRLVRYSAGQAGAESICNPIDNTLPSAGSGLFRWTRWRRRRGNRSWRRCRHWTLGAAGSTLIANRRELLLAFEVFVKTNGQVLDDVVLHFEAAFEFHDQIVVRSADLVVDVDAFAVLGNFVSELASAPMLGLFDLGAFVAAGVLHRVLHFLDFVFWRGRTDDKNQVVQTFFH